MFMRTLVRKVCLSRKGLQQMEDLKPGESGRTISVTEPEIAFENKQRYELQLENTLKSLINAQAGIDGKDKSPEAKQRRRRLLLRAVYGEFMCATIFYSLIFCYFTNAYLNNWSSGAYALGSAFVNGLAAIAMTYSFSSVSGAIINPAVGFALWLTGKLSNRKFVLFVIVDSIASICGVLIVCCLFVSNDSHSWDDIFQNLMVLPRDKDAVAHYFFTEFFQTFILTYMAFTVVYEEAESQKTESMSLQSISDSKGLTLYTATPQSKAGFAPIAIGFTVFSLCLVGGTSNGAFNPARIFGPAIFANEWRYVYYYWIADFSGGAMAGLLVHYTHSLGRMSELIAARLEHYLGGLIGEGKATKNEDYRPFKG